MHVTSIAVGPSPVRSGVVRLSAQVRYDRPGLDAETYWFEVAREHAADLARTGDPWLACLLPLAVTLGEPLRLSAAVDSVLLDGALEVMAVWHRWYPALRPIAVEAEEVIGGASGARVGAFFSGGVDSFFTLLHHESLARERPSTRIDDLITVWGFDIPIVDAVSFERLRARLQRVADALGKSLIVVATNLRQTEWRRADWGHLAHGCALAAVAHVLGPRWRSVLIAASNDYPHHVAWGSHPLTDALLGTARTRIVHDGAAFGRLDKVRAVARSQLALEALHVCWRGRSSENCGACAKCLTAMVALELLGVLDRASCFPSTAVDPRRVRRIHQHRAAGIRALAEMRVLARESGRPDLAAALGASIRRSRLINWALPRLQALSKRPAVWRLAVRLEELLIARSVR